MAEKNELSPLCDELMEALSGGALSEKDVDFILQCTEAYKLEGKSIDEILNVFDYIFKDKPDLCAEAHELIWQSWGDLALGESAGA